MTLDTPVSETHGTNASKLKNPFYTSEYIAYRSAQGYIPWILTNDTHEQSKLYCLAFMKSGRLRRSLEIPSMPDISEDNPFWQALMDFCRKKGISDLSVNSFGSQGGLIPVLPREQNRKTRWEYIIDLKTPDIIKKMSKLHVRKIKRAQKFSVKMRRMSNQQAVEAHAQLISLSMQRRKDRGEQVTTAVPMENISRLINAGAGEVFQAVLADKVISSNLILLAEKAGYNHSGGTSPEGMDCGASHFLFYEIACALRDEGMEILNLGGTDDPDPNSGLVRFKTGFGAEKIKLEAARFMPISFATSLLQCFLSP